MARGRRIKFSFLEVPVSPTRLNNSSCLLKYKHEYTQKPKPKITTPEFARGKLLHKRMTYLFNSDGTLHYKSPKAFANSIKGIWARVRQSGMHEGNKILWKNELEQPWWVLAEMLSILKAVYMTYEKEEPPLLIEAEISGTLSQKNLETLTSSDYDTFRLTGILDEIRVTDKGFVVRGNKTAWRVPNEQELTWDYQFTFYPLLLAQAIKSGKISFLVPLYHPLRDRLEAQMRRMEGKSLIEIASSIYLEYHDMRNRQKDKEPPEDLVDEIIKLILKRPSNYMKKIIEVGERIDDETGYGKSTIIPVLRRTPEHFLDLYDTIVSREKAIEHSALTGIWAANRKECGDCMWYPLCDKETKEETYSNSVPVQGQLFSIQNSKKSSSDQLRIKFPRGQKISTSSKHNQP